MSEPVEAKSAPRSITSTALDKGRSAINAAASGVKTGARVAAGTFFAGCNLLLDLGVGALRRLPLDDHPSSSVDAGKVTIASEESFSDSRDAMGARPLEKTPVPPLGWWRSAGEEPGSGEAALHDAIRDVTRAVHIVGFEGRTAVARGGSFTLGARRPDDVSLPMLAMAPGLHPDRLGDAAFKDAHGLRYAYVAGAMANGIGSEEILEAMSRVGMLAFFGAAGLSLARVESAIDRVQRNLGDAPFGFNLIHSPNEPALEAGVVDLYLRRGIRLVDASAYLDLTLPLVRYRVNGIYRDSVGRVICPNRVIAKVSRTEVARKFFSPPPDAMLAALVKTGEITDDQARLAAKVPVATDMTVEADSGGHTDNRPLVTLLPSMIALRDELQAAYQYGESLRVGAAGGIATPASAAAAFAMGAAYVMTGSINQACVEAGTSRTVREMLAEAGPADVMMAPAADMFEMGVRVQVLKWGTMFAVRARKLYELYRAHESLESIPARERAALERDYFRCSIEEAWSQTRQFFEARDATQISRAEADPKHKMALVFRSYLGRSSDWANKGEPTRKPDYQIWCGPAMGAFNEWTRGSFLESPDSRTVTAVAMNLMLGASVLTRVNWLAAQGIDVPPSVAHFTPMRLSEIDELLEE